MEIEQIVANLVQQVEHRFYGKYRGFVKDNADPEHLGRLKLQVPSVLGSDVVTGWATACVPYGGDADQGFLFIPEIGAGVWVEFEEGDLEFPIWVGTFWSKPGGDSELPKPNDADGTEQSDVQDPPTCKILKTKKGHTLQFEDADGDERITLYEGTNQHVITLDQDGIQIVDGANQHEITLAADGITIKDKSGNKIVTTNQGLTCTDANGNSIKMDAASGYPAGPGIDLNGGTRVCLQGLVDWLLSHQHVGNMGAPTPLFPADLISLQLKTNLPGGGVLSDTVKAK
jgi:uncharacterized protein involved in type VI secretion and phage assembly